MATGTRLEDNLKQELKELKRKRKNAINNLLGIGYTDEEMAATFDIPIKVLELKLQILDNRGKATFPTVIWSEAGERVQDFKYILTRSGRVCFYDKELDKWFKPEDLPKTQEVVMGKQDAWVTVRNGEIEIFQSDCNYWTGEISDTYIIHFLPEEYYEKVKEEKLKEGKLAKKEDTFKVHFIEE